MRAIERQGESLKYVAVEPDGFDPDRGYPMVILLHGFGASMDDLVPLCQPINSSAFVYVCPNAPLEIDVGMGLKGYAWAPLGEERTPGDTERSEAKLSTLFEEVMAYYQVPPGQAVLGGFSQGAMMTYNCGLTSPDLFVGLAALSGRVWDHDRLRARLPGETGQCIFIAHGDRDPLIPVTDARLSRQFLETCGYRPQYKEYAVGHEINQEMLVDLADWINAVLTAPGAISKRANDSPHSQRAQR